MLELEVDKMELRDHGKKIVLILIAAAIVLGAVVVFATQMENDRFNHYGIVVHTKMQELLSNGTWVWHDPIDEEFVMRTGGYWNLTNPDRYFLEALETKKVVYVTKNAPGLTIVKQLEEHNWNPIVKYNGKYYLVDVYGSPMHPWT